MKEFIKNLFSNRFGIVLAALNVCYFVSRNFAHFVFEHTHKEENCLFINHYILFWLNVSAAKLMLFINSPALILSLIPSKFMQITFPDFCVFTQAKFQIVFLIFFVTLQWLFIGWMAKAIAQRIQPTES